MRQRHRGFQPRECWICGKMINKHEDADFLHEAGDYNGCCKEHDIKNILITKKVPGSYYRYKMELKNPKEVKQFKLHNRMRNWIYTIFLAVVLYEIASILPKLIDKFLLK